MEGEKKAKPLFCPFCGAPQRTAVPSHTVQLRCQYCGGMMLIPPELGGGAQRCPNHPERFAVGRCNDCGENFCDGCLSIYELFERSESARLYLCPECLKKRYAAIGDLRILAGIVLLVLGIFTAPIMFIALQAVVVSVIFFVMAVVYIAYGIYKKGEASRVLTMNQLRIQEQKREAELGDLEDFDAEETYNKLYAHYINHWGLQTGIELLEGEIASYTRRGVSYPEAVMKVYQRQEQNLKSSKNHD